MSRGSVLVRLLATPVAVVITLVLIYVLVGKQTDSIAVSSLSGSDGATSAHAYDGNVVTALLQHLRLVAVSAVVVLLLGIPLGVLLTRTRSRAVRWIVNGSFSAGQAAPVIGILVLLVIWADGLKWWIPYVALVVYGTLPVMRNTVEGIRNVDPGLIDAARGQGFSRQQVLTKVELPLAVPIILAGVRTALVLLVGTATLATFVDGGGLGDIINDGISNQRDAVLLTGAILAAVLAVTIDWLAGLAERYLSPKGLRGAPA
ncbi:ABC transporter permease [Patulibacter sp. NPDC049589]|uniref:ABC transporter permease n=1 Tax=Patulibacter sp. NPDC049589 TaxID=3154731 RepID=UPI003443E933